MNQLNKVNTKKRLFPPLLLIFIFIAFQFCKISDENTNDQINDSTKIYDSLKQVEEDYNTRFDKSKMDSFKILMTKKNYSFTCINNCDVRGPNIRKADDEKGYNKPYDVKKDYFLDQKIFILTFSININCASTMMGNIKKGKSSLLLELENISHSYADCNCKFTYSLTVRDCEKAYSDVKIKVLSSNF